MTASTLTIGEWITVYISGRHDFTRQAKVLSVYRDEIIVEYESGKIETIPEWWL